MLLLYQARERTVDVAAAQDCCTRGDLHITALS